MNIKNFSLSSVLVIYMAIVFMMYGNVHAADATTSPKFNIDIAAFINNKSPDSKNPLAIAEDCLAGLALHTQGVTLALGRAKAAGDMLLLSMTTDSTGHSGWPYRQDDTQDTAKCAQAGSLDAFGDGTCNPPETPYMIQTGYAIACLAQLNIATGDTNYLKLAKSVVSDSWSLGTALPECNECFYYWYSYHPNDLNRYVRNTNLIMGEAVAWMYAATGENAYRDRALAIARAENYEIKAGNFGYFGINDMKYRANPKAEAQHIENHIPIHVKALKDISNLLGDTHAFDDSKTMLDAFLNCNNNRYCRPDNCRSWAAPLSCKATATIAPCILADRSEHYQLLCENVKKALSRLNAFQIFLSYAPSDAAKLRSR